MCSSDLAVGRLAHHVSAIAFCHGGNIMKKVLLVATAMAFALSVGGVSISTPAFAQSAKDKAALAECKNLADPKAKDECVKQAGAKAKAEKTEKVKTTEKAKKTEKVKTEKGKK